MLGLRVKDGGGVDEEGEVGGWEGDMWEGQGG